jgi:hypothetical protein
MRVVTRPDAVEFIRGRGGQLFVWASEHRCCRATLTLLDASTEPPARALEFRRLEAGGFLLFLHPSIRTLPEELHIDVRGRWRVRIEAYWEGCAYVI